MSGKCLNHLRAPLYLGSAEFTDGFLASNQAPSVPISWPPSHQRVSFYPRHPKMYDTYALYFHDHAGTSFGVSIFEVLYS